jgi:hypothetical protein
MFFMPAKSPRHRAKSHKLELAEIPVMVCDEWNPAQVKAFRLIAIDL